MVNQKKRTQLFDDESTKPRGNFSYLVNAFSFKIKEGMLSALRSRKERKKKKILRSKENESKKEENEEMVCVWASADAYIQGPLGFSSL